MGWLRRRLGLTIDSLPAADNCGNEQADAGSDVAIKACGASKHDRLAGIKQRFDPGNLFRLNQNILPRL